MPGHKRDSANARSALTPSGLIFHGRLRLTPRAAPHSYEEQYTGSMRQIVQSQRNRMFIEVVDLLIPFAPAERNVWFDVFIY